MALESMPDDEGIVDMKFYFGVYELDYGKKICLQSIKYYNKKNRKYDWGEFGGGDKYHTSYLSHFNFEDKFHDWFYNMPKWTTDIKWPTDEEHQLITEYFEKNTKQLY